MEGKNVYKHQKIVFQILGNANCYGDAFPDQVDYDQVEEDFCGQF